MPLQLSTIGQIAVTAKDVPRAAKFYKEVLGIKHLFDAPGLAFFDAGGVRLMVAAGEGEFDHPGSVLYFKVEDIHAAHEELKAKQVEFVREPHLIAKMPDHDLWMAFFRDTEDNVLALMCEKVR